MAKNRYIVLLDSQNEKSIRNVEKGFSVSVTSSEYLSKDNRSFNIIDNNNNDNQEDSNNDSLNVQTESEGHFDSQDNQQN